MVEVSSLIYGLELQARTLTPQHAEHNEIKFFIGTNSLKPTNQIHLLKYDEENDNIQSKIFEHALGEVWKLNSSRHDSRLLASCYSVQKGPQVLTNAALFTLPENLEDPNPKEEFLPWDNVEILETEQFGERVKTIEFHPERNDILGSAIDGKVVIFDRTSSQTRVIAEVTSSSNKHTTPITTGKWGYHQQNNQFITLHDSNIRAFDIRDMQNCSWTIEEAHAPTVRDFDCNPNRQCHIVTGGDDGYIKIWDTRMSKEPVFARNDHAHWIWCVRYNRFHDEMILSSSSDCKVLLTCASSVCSEADGSVKMTAIKKYHKALGSGDEQQQQQQQRAILSDGLLHTFDQHEDSVYCVEWSNVDPWIFASLSYDGRALITKVPKQYKYQIIF